MISGMYLGEITRNVLLHLIDQRLLFEGTSSTTLNRQWAFETKFMSAIEQDNSSTLIPIAQILEQELGIYLNTQVDREIVKFVCQLVGKRAARLSAMAIAAVVRQGLKAGTLSGYGYPLKISANDEVLQRQNGDKVGSVGNGAPTRDVIQVGIDGSVFEHYPHFEERMYEALDEILGSGAREVIVLGTAR